MSRHLPDPNKQTNKQTNPSLFGIFKQKKKALINNNLKKKFFCKKEKLKKSKGIYFIFIKNAIGGLGFSFKQS